MPLNEIKIYELTCDAGLSADCRVRSRQSQPARVTAFSLKHAHQLVREAGWKINDGRRDGSTKYVCPGCQTTAAKKRFPKAVPAGR